MEATSAARAGGIPALLGEWGGLLPLAPVFAWWAIWRGGYPATVYLAGLVVLCAAAIALGLARRAVLPGRAAALALLCGLALVAWSACSIAWARGDRQAALLATLRLALYLLIVALPLLWPPTPRALRWALIAFVAAVLGGAASALAAGTGALADGRLLVPTGYVNATAALFASGALVAVALAARPGAGGLWRALAMAAATTLLGFGLLAESRGATGTLALTLVIALALSPWRARFGAHALLAGAVLAVRAPVLLHVRNITLYAAHPRLVGRHALLELALLGAAAGAGSALFEPRLPRVHVGRRAAIAAGALAAILLAVAAVTVVPRAINSLTHPDYAQLERSSTRFTGDLGSFRPTYWSAAARIGADHPLLGVGAGGFAQAYLVARTHRVAPLFAHDIWLQEFADLGLPGLLALLAFCVLLARALWPGRRSALLGAAALPLLYLTIHGALDWSTAFPAVAGPVLGLGAAAAALASPAPGRALRGMPVWGVALAALAVVASVQLVSARLLERAYAEWRTQPAAAFADLHRAARLAPLDAAPALAEGIIDIELGRPAQAALTRARSRDPQDWLAPYALGLLAASRGESALASRLYAQAAARNRDERALERARAALDARIRLDPAKELALTLARGD